jgi:hypothetical protein
MLRSVPDVSDLRTRLFLYLESLLAFVCTYKQPKAKRRIMRSTLGELQSRLRACDRGSWARDKAGAEIGMRA